MNGNASAGIKPAATGKFFLDMLCFGSRKLCVFCIPPLFGGIACGDNTAGVKPAATENRFFATQA